MRIEMWSLAGLRSSETAHNFAIRIDLQNAAGDSVGHIKGVVWGQHQAKWAPKFPLPQKPAIPVEDLDAGILPVANVDQVAINHDRVWSVELSRPGALHSPTKQFIAVLVELQHPRIPVAIRDVDVTVSVPGNVGWLIEVPHVISGNTHPPQCKQHPPFRAELQYYVGTHVGGPDVALSIHANHVRGDKKIVGDAAEEFSGSIEFHQRMLAAMENVNVALRVHSHASGFYEVLLWRQLKEAGNDIVVDRRGRQIVRPLSRGCTSPQPKQEAHQDYRQKTAFSVHG